MKAVGLILILLGIVALAYQGITYTTREEVVDIGGLKVQSEERTSIPLPPILGGLALAVGIILVIAGAAEGEGKSSSAPHHTTEVHHHHSGGGTPNSLT